jgi:hypothetical protein
VREHISLCATTKTPGGLLVHTFYHPYDITVHGLRSFTVYALSVSKKCFQSAAPACTLSETRRCF